MIPELFSGMSEEEVLQYLGLKLSDVIYCRTFRDCDRLPGDFGCFDLHNQIL